MSQQFVAENSLHCVLFCVHRHMLCRNQLIIDTLLCIFSPVAHMYVYVYTEYVMVSRLSVVFQGD